MEQRILLLELSRQLYEDFRFLAQNNSTQQVDEDSALAFNAVLREAQTLFSNYTFIQHLREFAPRNVKFKDAMVVSGQLYTLLHHLLETEFPAVSAPSNKSETLSPEKEPAKTTAAPPALAPASSRQITPPEAPAAAAAEKKRTGFLTEDELRISFKDLK